MEHQKRYHRIWNTYYSPVEWFIKKKYDMSVETFSQEGPALIICNHVSNWDPIFVGLCSPKRELLFIASEHLMRNGLTSKLLNHFFGIIARPKASGSTQTIITCMKELRAGNSVCLFAEGDGTWNGITQPIPPATGKLARSSGASLITVRTEGLYLVDPRWAHDQRKGHFSIKPVHVYSPEELKAMTPEEITEAINRDIYYNIWEDQRVHPVAFKTKTRTNRLESALFMCPKCHRIGTLKGKGDRFACSCGLETYMTPEGFFSPAEPFETIADWDAFQHEALKKGDFVHETDVLFSDERAVLIEIQNGHRTLDRDRGELVCYDNRICIGERAFTFDEITDMSMVKTNRLLFSAGHEYYEVKVPKNTCLRKYLAMWRDKHSSPVE